MMGVIKHPWKIYEDELYSKGYGLPLWYPEPSTDATGNESGREIQIGDVGYVEDGVFFSLFNTMNGASFGPWDPPSEPLTIHPQLFRTQADAIPVGQTIFSAGINTVEAGAEAHAGDLAGFSANFQTSKEKAAFLFVRGGASRVTVMTNKNMQSYVLKNIHDWVATLNNALGADTKRAEDLYFIRGHIKTTSWGVAAIAASHSRQAVSIAAGYGPASGSVRITHDKANVASLDQRWGPKDPNHNVFDQCLFVNYYRYRKRLGFIPHLKAGAGPHTLPDGGSSDEEEGVIVRDNETPLDVDPVNHLLDYILKHSDADAAVASDGDLAELLGNEDWPDNIPDILVEKMPEIEIIDGVGVISQEKAVYRAHFRAVEEDEAPEVPVEPEAGPSEQSDGSTSQHPEASTSQEQVGSSDEVATAQDAPATTGDANSGDAEETKEEEETRKTTPAASISVMGRIVVKDHTMDWPHRQLVDNENIDGSSIGSFQFSPNAEYVAVSYDDGQIRVWHTQRWKLVLRISDHHTESVTALKFSPDSTRLAAATRRGYVWDISRAPAGIYSDVCQLQGLGEQPNDLVWDLAWSPDGKAIATAASDSKVRIFNPSNGVPVRILETQHLVSRVTYSPDGKYIVAIAKSSGYIWNAVSGEQVGMMDGHTRDIWCLSISPDSQRVITGSDDYTHRVWDINNGVALVLFNEHTGPVWSVGFSEDGKEVMASSNDGTVSICDSYDGTRRHLLQNSSISISTASYSQQSNFIATGLFDGEVKLWDVKSGAEVCSLHGHEDSIKELRFSPDDDSFVTSSDDGTMRVWSLLDVLRVSC
ncbi:hypothetical protein BXZ70DRAFT_933946 [Cristinia sonorae]|uniref:Anaphase-promoting complex subunit 4-like WD40 domain-containing protein n=1 Tax=Cristinia sonorae TaxID=1940300 RepID=A0A8K0XQX8_9AGAR|nr:hypothetical protein BXZ70DRAFT_933946 [Cristinia sonorae]